jgi:hypothetical protein
VLRFDGLEHDGDFLARDDIYAKVDITYLIEKSVIRFLSKYKMIALPSEPEPFSFIFLLQQDPWPFVVQLNQRWWAFERLSEEWEERSSWVELMIQ